MIIQCPNCKTKYNLDESRVKDEVRLRCTRCGNVFKFSDLDQEKGKDDFAAKWRQEEKKQKPAKPDVPFDDLNEYLARRRKIRRWIFTLAAILFIALGVYFALPILDNRITIPFITSQEEKVKIPPQTEFTEKDVRDISLENIRQYFVNNDKIGQLFVVEGQAVNNFNEPKSMIKLRASLYNAGGSVLVEKDFLCGNVASLFQLQVSSQEELESTLQSRLGILTTNKLVEPGGYSPFMVVFYNPPEEVQEFGLEVIEAHDPTP